MYKFIHIDEDGKTKRTVPYDDATWQELVEEFQIFLTDCSYVFADGFNMADILQEEHYKMLSKQAKKKLKEEWVWE